MLTFESIGVQQILDDISFTVDANEIVSLLGPSGSGKTTLLRVTMGLTAPDAGHITYINADDVSLAELSWDLFSRTALPETPVAGRTLL
ncbi:MAG: ATP-binding cassette domain-containing protein, partial [Verrucomicrobiota bacterium]